MKAKDIFDDTLKWITRGAMIFTAVVIMEMRTDVKLLLSDYAAFIQWKVEVNRRLDGHDARLDNHARAINKIKVE